MSAETAKSIALADPFVETINFMDTRVDLVTSERLLQLTSDCIANQCKIVIASHNLHSLCLQTESSGKEGSFRRFYEDADYTLADGMSIVLLGKMYGKNITRAHRVPFNDWLPVLLPAAVRNKWRIFYLGSTATAALKGAEILRTRYPGLQLKSHHGHFDAQRDSDPNKRVLSEIARYRPHILFVGMGMPRQEVWIQENRDHIYANVILPSGATLDYIAGDKLMAPRWLGTLGLEWAFRLATEPKRLARRYLLLPWVLLPAIMQAQLQGRRSVRSAEEV